MPGALCLLECGNQQLVQRVKECRQPEPSNHWVSRARDCSAVKIESRQSPHACALSIAATRNKSTAPRRLQLRFFKGGSLWYNPVRSVERKHSEFYSVQKRERRVSGRVAKVKNR
jgi:hypothetical protein